MYIRKYIGYLLHATQINGTTTTLWLQKSVIDFRNNFLRLCVLKVTQQSEKHLEKILNVDEFVKRVFSVIHSNDPVARAITLRFFSFFFFLTFYHTILCSVCHSFAACVCLLLLLLIRMLGSLASIIPERKNAHHSIRQSLDSHDNMEVEAAIFAAASFSAQSK